MQYIDIGGVRQPLDARAWNPRYRAGIRFCALALARRGQTAHVSTYVYQGEEFHIESDMWAIAEAVLQMSIPDRLEHNWPDIGWD